MNKKEMIKQRLKERTASKRYTLKEGENTFRVLPNKRGEEHLDFFEYGMHSKIGPKLRYLRCGKKRNGKGECWQCDKNAELAESKKASHRAAAEATARIEKFATQISPIDDGTWLLPTLFEMPASLANALLGIMHRKAVTDLKKGYNLSVDRVGTTFKGTKYGSLVVDDEPSKVPSKIVEAMKTFDELVPKYSEAQQKEAYYGEEREEDEDEEETPKKKPAVEDDEEEEEEEETPKKKKKPVVDEEEEADEEDSEFEELADEEEEETPKKKKKRVVEEEEEEEETEEEEEEPEDEEETPKKKKRKVEEEEEEEEEETEEEEEEEETPKKKKKKPVVEDEEDE